MTTGTDTTKAQQEGNSVAETQCAGTIPIIPVRYAIVPRKDDNQPQYLYQDASCGSRLEQGFEKVERSVYTLRTLREGFIYVFDETKATVTAWEADGKGHYKKLLKPELDNYLQPANQDTSSQKYIDILEDSKTVHIGFTSGLLTQAKIKDVEKSEDFRKSFMIPIDVSELTNASGSDTTQQHLFPTKEISSVVEEFKQSIGDYSWSVDKPDNQVPVRYYDMMAKNVDDYLKPKAPAVVALYDNERIASDIASIAANYLDDYLGAYQVLEAKGKAKEGLPEPLFFKQRKDYDNCAEFHRKKIVSDLILQSLYSLKPKEKDEHGLSEQEKRDAARNALKADISRTKVRKELYRQSLNLTTRHYAALALWDGVRDYFADDRMLEEAATHINFDKLEAFNKDWDQRQQALLAFKPHVEQSIKDQASWLRTAESLYGNKPVSLASALNVYDRDNIHCGQQLELNLAYCFLGVGSHLPGEYDRDPRIPLFDRWLKDEGSPFFMSIAGYRKILKDIENKDFFAEGDAGFENSISKFSDNYDTLHAKFSALEQLGNKAEPVVSSAGGALETLLEKYPYTVATELNVRTFIAIIGRNLRSAHKWTSDLKVAGNLYKMLAKSPYKKMMKLLNHRYGITKKTLNNLPDDINYLLVINRAKTQNYNRALSFKNIGKGKTAKFSASKLDDVDIKANPLMSSAMLREIGKISFTGFAGFLHWLNVGSAIKSFETDQSMANRINLAGSLFGIGGAFIDFSASAVTIMNKSAEKLIPKKSVLAGILRRVINNTLFKAAGTVAWTKATGWIGAVIEAGYYWFEAGTLALKGDNDAAGWSFGAGVGFAGFSLSLMYAGLALKGGAALLSVPVVGWIAAAVILLVVGIWCSYEMLASTDTPLQKWLHRTVFGAQDNKEYQPFTSLEETLDEFFVVMRSPTMITDKSDQLEKYLKDKNFNEDATNTWHENGLYKDEVEYLIQLPGYKDGQSHFELTIYGYEKDDISAEIDNGKLDDSHYKNHKPLELKSRADIEAIMYQDSLIINAKKLFSQSEVQSARLEISYWPDSGQKKKKVTTNFFLDD